MDSHDKKGTGLRLEPSHSLKAVVRDQQHRAIATVTYAIVPGGTELRLGIIKVEHYSPDEHTLITEDFPVRWALDAANEPAVLLMLLDLRHVPDKPGEPLPMLLPPGEVMGGGRKPDSFYERVAYLVRYCAEHGIAHGPRLAKDNHVPESTVYRWVHEARRRGLLEETN